MYTKHNPFIQIFEAFRGFINGTAFYNLRRQTTGSKICYAFIISILYSLIFCSLLTYKINTNKDLNNLLNSIPEFTYLDGELSCRERYEFLQDDTYLLVDTEQTKWDVSRITLKQNRSGEVNTQSFHQGSTSDINTYIQKALDNKNITTMILVSKTNIFIFYPHDFTYNDTPISKIADTFKISAASNVQILSSYKKFVAKIVMLVALFLIPLQVMSLFLTTLFLTLLGLIVNAAFQSKESFATLYWISFYIESILSIAGVIAGTIVILPLHLRLSSISIAVLLFYILIMIRTLRKGEAPAIKPIIVNSLNDDLDAFMKESAAPPVNDFVSSPFSAEDTYRKPDNMNFNNTSSDISLTENKSGLSLKND